MTPEQFCFWLKGYLCGGRDNDSDAIVADVVRMIKKVQLHQPIISEDDETPDVE